MMADTMYEPGLSCDGIWWVFDTHCLNWLFKFVKYYKYMQPWTWHSFPLSLSLSPHPLVFACLGFLSPANRGALMTCAVVLWVLLGTPAGYVAARYYKCKYTSEVWPLTSDPPFIRAVCSSLDLISVKGALYPNRQAYTPLLLFCFSCVGRLVQITMRAYSSFSRPAVSSYDISCRSICWALSVLTSVIQQMFNCPLWSSLFFICLFLVRNSIMNEHLCIYF